MSLPALPADKYLMPCFCKPYPGEVIGSWLARTAFEYGLTTVEFSRIAWLDTEWNGRDVDRYIPDAGIYLLSSQSNCSFEEIKNCCLLFYENRLMYDHPYKYHPDKWMLPRRDPTVGKFIGGQLYCPGCFAKGKIYFKKEWRMALAFVCEDCGCYLMEDCPCCRKAITYVNKPVGDRIKDVSGYLGTCHHCFSPYALCEPIPAPVKLLNLQTEFYRIMEEGYKNLIYTASYFDVIHRMATMLLTGRYSLVASNRERLIPFIDQIYTYHESCSVNKFKDKGPLQHLPVQERAMVLMMAHWLLDKWPKRFLRLCKLHNLIGGDILSWFEEAPFWFWEPVYNTLPATVNWAVPVMPFGLKSIFEKPRQKDREYREKRKTQRKRWMYQGKNIPLRLSRGIG